MAEIVWSDAKNAELKQRYGFGFERVVVALGEDGLIDERAHPNTLRYGHQRQLVLLFDDYVWIVPFVADGESVFLKTMFPSRKATQPTLETMTVIGRRDISVDEERDLVESTERGEWVSIGLTDERRDFWKSAARSVIDGKRRRISIAVPERDLARLKTRAAEEGMPYQTLINSIIHKYLQGE